MSFEKLLRAITSVVSRIKSTLFSAPARQTRSNQKFSEENFSRYCLGGYHPVRIGDRFNDGKYEVIRKVGYGQYSTVWLVRDIG